MAESVRGSFRDPSGRVFRRDGVLYRQVNHAYRADYEALVGSGLHATLVESGLLVDHDVVDAQVLGEEAWLVLRPEMIAFVSYPYEWCFGQLRDAALLTLEVQRLALDHGMSLRDASAYNVQFHHGRPILIDTLSFETWRRQQPWVAYGQFCRHFLAPLALIAHRDRRLGTLSRQHIDGVPLDLAVGLLPWWTRLRPSLLIHLHAHARALRARAGAGRPGDARFGERAMRGLIDSLTRAVRGLPDSTADSTWSGYYGGDSYTDHGLRHKLELVEAFLSSARPATVWDLGANTGLFSRLAADQGAKVVAFDSDPASVEAAYRRGESGVLPLVLDLVAPSPAIGWANRERMSLAERGPADLVMALALVHHLAIANNVPLDEVASHLAELGRAAIVEFVPKTDPKVGALLSSRQDIFSRYTHDGFEQAFSRHFVIERRERIKDSERLLYLMRRVG